MKIQNVLVYFWTREKEERKHFASNKSGQNIRNSFKSIQFCKYWSISIKANCVLGIFHFLLKAILLSSDGQNLVTGGDNGVVEVWQACDFKQLYIYPGCDAGIRAMDLSHDQRWIFHSYLYVNTKITESIHLYELWIYGIESLTGCIRNNYSVVFLLIYLIQHLLWYLNLIMEALNIKVRFYFTEVSKPDTQIAKYD